MQLLQGQQQLGGPVNAQNALMLQIVQVLQERSVPATAAIPVAPAPAPAPLPVAVPAPVAAVPPAVAAGGGGQQALLQQFAAMLATQGAVAPAVAPVVPEPPSVVPPAPAAGGADTQQVGAMLGSLCAASTQLPGISLRINRHLVHVPGCLQLC